MAMEQDTAASAAFEFEGDEVSNFTAQIPAVKLDADAAYPRGTYLTLRVVVRVKSVRLEEDRKGALARNHILALEECTITDTLTPAQRRALLEAAERAATELEVEEVPGPDLAYQGASSETEVPVINDIPVVDTAETPHPDDDDSDAWDDEDEYPAGTLHVELVEAV